MAKKFLCCLATTFFWTALVSLAEAQEYRTVSDLSYYDGAALSDEAFAGNTQYRAERCKLDLYLPPEGEKFPVVVWFHGGGLSSGNKHIPNELKNKGIGVVAVNYWLSSERAKCPDYLTDAAAAVAWTLAKIGEYGGDTERVYVSGHSAGGYLTAMLALDPSWLALFGRSNNEIAGAFPISGQVTTHFQILNERYGRNLVPSYPAEIDALAPLHFTAAEAPPMYLLVGDPAIEWPARVEENAFLAAMLKLPKDHGTVIYRSFSGADHGTVVAPAVEFMTEQILTEKE